MPDESTEKEVLFTWTSFPVVDNPKKSLLATLVICFTAYILWEIAIVKWDQPLYYVLGILVLVISLAPYFVPTTYFFYKSGLLVQYPFVKVEKNYIDFGCFYYDKLGILLSTYKQPRRMDVFRGQSIRFSKTQAEKEQIISFLKEKIKKY